MSSFIRQLHKKPKRVRRQIALAISSLLTFFIFTVWLSSFPSNLSKKNYAEVSPLRNLKDSLAGSYAAFKGTIADTNAGLKEVQE